MGDDETVTEGESTLTFLTESLPEFKVGKEYQELVQVIGGTPPYQFATTKGNWPTGITFFPNGEITGVPEAGENTTVFVQVTDGDGSTETQAFNCEMSHD